MATLRSAGLLMYRHGPEGLQVLLAHPGGPFWARRDEGAWTLPKGLHADGEEPLAAACREFREETGFACRPPYLPLGECTLKGGKRIAAWAFEGDADPGQVASNVFELEWPPRSGRRAQFPEVDRVAWFGLAEARRKLLPAQAVFIDSLEAVLRPAPSGS